MFHLVRLPFEFPFPSFAFSRPFPALLRRSVGRRFLVLRGPPVVAFGVLAVFLLVVLPSGGPGWSSVGPCWRPKPLLGLEFLLGRFQLWPEVGTSFSLVWNQLQQVSLLPTALTHVHLDALEPLDCDVEASHCIVLADPIDDRCQSSELPDISDSRDLLWDPRKEYLAQVSSSHWWE